MGTPGAFAWVHCSMTSIVRTTTGAEALRRGAAVLVRRCLRPMDAPSVRNRTSDGGELINPANVGKGSMSWPAAPIPHVSAAVR